jgi:hypothetical protein
MKKNILLFILPLLLLSCENILEVQEIDLKAVIRLTPAEPFETSDTNGIFIENTEFDPSDVEEETEDLELTNLTEVNISSINLTIDELTANEAELLIISGYYEDTETERTPIFLDYAFDLSELSDTEAVAVNGYQLSGINLLSEQMLNILRNNSFSPFTLSIEGYSADANGNPSGEAIQLVIDLEVEAEAIFTEEIEVPNFP